MPSKAIVIVTGHAGKDCEMRYSQNGTAMASFSVATNKWRGQDRDDATTWWNVTAFGRLAERINDRLRKGDLVQVTGEAYEDEWTGQDGQPRKSLKIDANDVLVFGRRDDSQGEPPRDDNETIPF